MIHFHPQIMNRFTWVILFTLQITANDCDISIYFDALTATIFLNFLYCNNNIKGVELYSCGVFLGKNETFVYHINTDFIIDISIVSILSFLEIMTDSVIV